jgi:hypothetical protein
MKAIFDECVYAHNSHYYQVEHDMFKTKIVAQAYNMLQFTIWSGEISKDKVENVKSTNLDKICTISSDDVASNLYTQRCQRHSQLQTQKHWKNALNYFLNSKN